MKISLRLKILVPSLFVLFAGLAAVFFIAGFTGEKMLTTEMVGKTKFSLESLIARSEESDAEVKMLKETMSHNFLRLTHSVAKLVAEAPELLETAELQALTKKLDIDEIHVTDEEGVLRWGSVPDFFGFDFSTSDQTRPFLKGLTDEGFAFAQEPQPRGVDDILFQYIGVARIGRPGIVQIGVQARELQEVLERVDLQTLVEHYKVDDDGGSAFVLDDRGNTLYHKNPERVGVSVKDYDWGNTVLAEQEGFFFYDFEGQEKLMSFRRVGGRIFCASVFTAPYLGPLEIMEDALLITSVVIAVILSLLIITLLNRIAVRPLRGLQGMVLVLAEGEGDLTQEIEAKSQDEVGDLGRGVNTFLISLRKIVGNIKAASAETQVIKENLRRNAEDSSIAVRQITGNVEEISQRIAGLDERITESSATVEQIEGNISELNRQIENQGSAVEESTASVNEMVASLKSVAYITLAKREATVNLVDTTRRGGEKVAHMKQVVGDIHGSVGQITEMVSLINDIASQTDLLSMNAAIEAAHAGDAGRGFAVVAEEIRKLSESTGENAKAINDVLLSIGGQAREASLGSQEADKAFGEINQEVLSVSQALAEINASTEELSVGGEQILEAMHLLQDVSSRVRESSEEMGRGAQGMGAAMKGVQEISGEVRGLVGEIAEGSSLIARRTEAVDRLTIELSDNTQGLNQEIHRFKTE